MAQHALEKARIRAATSEVTTRGRQREAAEAAADLRRAEESVEAAQTAVTELEALMKENE